MLFDLPSFFAAGRFGGLREVYSQLLQPGHLALLLLQSLGQALRFFAGDDFIKSCGHFTVYLKLTTVLVVLKTNEYLS